MRLSTVLVLLMAFAVIGKADPRLWDLRGVDVTHSGFVEWNRLLSQNNAGAAVTVWSDIHSGSREVYAQLIEPTGDHPWGSGVQVTTDLREQSSAVVTATDGGWIVAWIDYRDSMATGGEIRLQKLNDQGQPQWGADGIRVEGTVDVVRDSPQLVSDAAGGALLAWSHYDADGAHVHVQGITAAGSPAWPADTLGLDIYWGLFSAASDCSGGMIVAWGNYVCRINPDGSLPWGAYVAVGSGSGAVIASESSGGCYLAWSRPNGSNDHNICAQRVNPAGDLLWGPSGHLVCGSSGDQDRPSVVASFNDGANDGCFVTWRDFRTLWGTYYAQKLDTAAAALWGDNGRMLCDSTTSYLPSSLASDHLGGLTCAWEDFRNAYSDRMLGLDIRALHLNAAGQSLWSPQYVPVCLSPRYQTAPVIVPQAGGYLVIFQQAGNTTQFVSGLSYQKLDGLTGAQQFADTGVALAWHPTGELGITRGLSLPEGRTALVWVSDQVHYQILNSGGGATLNSDTAVIAADSMGGVWDIPALCSDGSGGFFAALLPYGSGYYPQKVFLAHVSSEGQVVGNGQARCIWTATGNGTVQGAAIAADNTGGCYVALALWAPADSGTYIMRLNSDGVPMWSVPVRLDLCADLLFNVHGTAITAPNGDCFVAWANFYEQGPCRMARVSGNGDILWSVTISDSTGAPGQPELLLDGTGGVYCSWYGPFDPDSDTRDSRIYAQHVTATGEVLWPANGIRVYTPECRQDESCSAVDNSGNLFVVWTSPNPVTYYYGVHAQKLSPNGTRCWSDTGRCAATDASCPGAASDGADGLFVISEGTIGVRSTHFNADGTRGQDPFYQSDEGGLLSDSSAMPGYQPLLIANSQGGAVAVWSESLQQSRDNSSDLFAQRIVPMSLAASNKTSALPLRYALYQNYPNPFNPTTLIQFDLARAGMTKLTVFNVLGREVTTLVNRNLPAGQHRAELDASALASGVYFYRLQSGNFTSTRKMIGLK